MAAPADRVQLRKNESAAGGGDAADDDLGFPALLDPNEDAPEMQGWFLQPPKPSTTRDELVYCRRDSSGNLILRDEVDATERTLSSLLTGGSGITEAQHESLDRNTHVINETSFDEIEYQDEEKKKRITRLTVWDSSSKTTKRRETLIVYGTDSLKKKPIRVDTIQFDGAGVEKERLTEVFSYSTTAPKNKLTDITRTKI